MALTKLILKEGIDSIYNNYAPTQEEAAKQWAEVFDTYAKGLFSYNPIFPTDLAKEAFINKFLTMTPIIGQVEFPIAFFDYVVILATLTGPTYTSTPPPIPPDFTTFYALGLAGGSKEECATLITEILDIWIRTGTSTDSVPITLPWS